MPDGRYYRTVPGWRTYRDSNYRGDGVRARDDTGSPTTLGRRQ